MSTSVTKPSREPSRRRMKRTAVTGASLALLCVVFTVIYEHFSHGAASSHMRAMFLMPLLGVALPALICFLTPLHRFVGRLPFNLWNSGMATWVVGCLFRGIVNISGRHTSLDRPYLVAGWVFITLSVIAEAVRLMTQRKHRTP